MKVDKNARYTKTHEWVRKEGELIVYGITDHAQNELSDIVYVEFPEVGASFSKGDTLGVIESVKAASDLYIPMSGEIVAVNTTLENSPDLVNKDPYGEGWLVKFKPTNPQEWDELLTPEAYQELTGE